ncbi:hypothetical protein J5N97_002149 [Dioscorea zingiberensis]|uniref:protein-disulfide reductase n=1 Tax=Dioscorea zingiberensis TaxID=325984 RepID=A0A9D5HP69_9LILI|nr:hypothetical protein J5N97_002149 [Dioscorea zingiberensis]
MADVETAVNGVGGHDLVSILADESRDFLVRHNGDQVKISDLKGKTVALYFSASWCGPCRRFTPKLVEVYGELASKGEQFEVVFVSGDEDEESFNGYFAKMPWLAVPFADAKTRDSLNDLFKVRGIPHMVVLNESGVVTNENGVTALREYGTEAYPFSEEKIKQFQEAEAAAKEAQTLGSVLVSGSRDYLVSNDGTKVPVSELEGKVVGLYFSVSSFPPSREFTPVLVRMYNKLKEKGENFEIVLVSLDDDEVTFNLSFAGMPWLAIPFKDKSLEKLPRYFELETLPTLVVLGPDGKTLNSNVAELVEEHGSEVYPFTPERIKELNELAKAKSESQTLESLLVSGDLDYVIGKDGTKIPVSELVGKNILLYFSAHWCPPCRAFLPQLIATYNKIKEKDSAFELVFLSSDRDQSSFDDYFAEMPWLALPFGDERKKSLSRKFKIRGIPSLVAIGPSGRTVTTEARDLITVHGADAYPFTDERIKELEAEIEEMAKSWPKTVKHPLHEEHELVLTRRRRYNCDGCEDGGQGWSFYCKECDFDLHPKCALEDDKEKETAKEDGNDNAGEDHANKEGYVCDGDVCYKA